MTRSKDGFSESFVGVSEQKAATESKNHNAGHRERLRLRFSNNAGESLADYELLELLLFRSVPRQDTKPIAKDLLARFGSFAEVLGASEKLLQEVKGVGPLVARDLKIIAAAAGRMSRGEVAERPLLSSGANVLEYCRTAMAFETVEQLRVLFLDKKNMLIADEVLQRGTVDHTPVYPRELAKRALELSASSIILVHNHPSGDATPSRADIVMTKKIMDTLDPLEIAVHDHIVVGKNGHASMRAMELI